MPPSSNALKRDAEAAEDDPLLPKKGVKIDAAALAGLGSAGSLVHFLNQLAHDFGYKLLVLLFATQHLLKGFAAAFIGPPSQYLLASYKVEGPRLGVFNGVAALPWAMKPIIGLVSDCFPIAGFNKGPYMFIASVAGMSAAAVVGLVPRDSLNVEHAVACLFIIQLQLAVCDLLSEAKYAEKMQMKPEQGPNLMTYAWFGLTAGGLAATFMVGPCIAHLGVKAAYILVIVPLAFVLVPLAMNYTEEKQATSDEIVASRRHMLEQKEAVFLCILMFMGTASLAVLGTHFQSIELSAAASLIVGLVMLIAFTAVLKPIIAKVNLFFLIQTTCSLNLGGATFYFYTDDATQYPEGPNFSMEFYTSVLGIVGSLCSMFGIYTYQRYMQSWSYRSLLLSTNLVLSVLSIADIIMLSRLNIRWGLPDNFFILGASVFQVVIAQWQWMPGVVINSQLCPKGMEATMYALLAGCHNLGGTIASSCGALLLKWLNCTPSGQPGESDKFANLWKAAMVSTVLPMFTLFLLPWLIPDGRQTDKLLSDEENNDATSGSLWKRWWGEKSHRSVM